MSPQALADKPQSAAKPAAEARRYKNFINGQWVDSSSGKSTPNINPANTDDIIGHAPVFADRVEDRADGLRLHQRRRAAAEEDR